MNVKVKEHKTSFADLSLCEWLVVVLAVTVSDVNLEMWQRL